MISLAQAQQVLSMCEKKAKELGVAVSISVVDRSGILVAALRMDGALSISPDFAFTKAFSAATIGAPTSTLGEYAQPGKPYFGLNTLFGGKITTIAGGQPIIHDGEVIGGVGVGGSMDVTQDDACALAGSKV